MNTLKASRKQVPGQVSRQKYQMIPLLIVRSPKLPGDTKVFKTVPLEPYSKPGFEAHSLRRF